MAAPHPTAAWVVELLKKSSFLGHLPDAVLESVVRAGHQRRFAKGEEIFRREIGRASCRERV